ncbi:MAG: ribose-phosphate diphosphokinase [Patescibacteria group bacterium]
MNEIKIFSGRSQPELAEKVCKKLKISLSKPKIEEFKNCCFEPALGKNIKDNDIFLFQTSRPNNDLHKDIFELLQMANAAKNSQAKKIIAVMPYVSYARSDKAYSRGMGVASELLAKLLERSGITGFVGIDFHSARFENFFSSKVYQLSAINLLAESLKNTDPKNAFILPADMGAFEKGSILAKKLKMQIGAVEKRRVSDTEVEIKKITGDFINKDIIIFDDEISTGSTLKTLAEKIQKRAKSISFAVTHGLFVGNAVKNFQEIKKLKQIILTDTVPISEELKKSLPLKIVSVDGLLTEKIKEICKN